MIKVYIEQAINGIEAERDQLIADVKARASIEVASQNTEIDNAKDKAIEALQEKLDKDIINLQEQFAKQQQEIINASERQKEENTNARINIETASINAEYDVKLAELRKIIGA